MTDSTVKTRRRSQRSIDTKQALLAHAKQIFSQQGFERATTKDIAHAAQVAEGTLFHHFPNKLALLEGAMGDYYGRLQAEAELIHASELETVQKLKALIMNHLKSAEAEWDLLRIVGQYGRYGDAGFSQKFYVLNKTYTGLFTDLIDSLKANFQIRATTPTPLIRDTLFGSMEHFFVGHFGRERAYNLEQYSDELLDLVFFGCGAR
ncbi:MAG: AcrR family transcriptional regulator [Cellvibrionaceae bacterium]|jgi:AcrR family transcriptional regulator